MTNSATERRPGKRERLVESARELFHEQGVHRTTLAEVAEHADVPVGNVYYYFKSKDELIGAVLDGYQAQAATLIQTFARHGCPMGTLCAELDKTEGGHDREAAGVMALIVDWAESQFRLLGKRDARDLAVALFAGIQGAALLANTFRDPTILTRQTRHLERWIDGLASQ
jgi:TetR/AcrR family transcriptional regulator, transcriptional repressor for nem operon